MIIFGFLMEITDHVKAFVEELKTKINGRGDQNYGYKVRFRRGTVQEVSY